MKSSNVKMTWIVSKAAAEAAEASAKNDIFAACYAKNEKALDKHGKL